MMRLLVAKLLKVFKVYEFQNMVGLIVSFYILNGVENLPIVALSAAAFCCASNSFTKCDINPYRLHDVIFVLYIFIMFY